TPAAIKMRGKSPNSPVTNQVPRPASRPKTPSAASGMRTRSTENPPRELLGCVAMLLAQSPRLQRERTEHDPREDQRHVIDDIVALNHALRERLEVIDNAGVADDRANRATQKLTKVVAQPQKQQQRKRDDRRDDLITRQTRSPQTNRQKRG